MMRSIHRCGEAGWLVAIALALTSMVFAGAVAAQDEPGAPPADEVANEVLDDDSLFEEHPSTSDEGLEDELTDDEVVEGSSAPDPHAGLETITVTAQKRRQTLQEVPAAVTAISGGQLDEAGFTQMQDIASVVPNMHYGQEQGSAKITIRGISNAQGTDQSTAFHIDGVYQNRAKAITSLTFFDLQRIEVLRGPQGTLYGRNATGGAINVISNPPSEDFELFGDVQFGNYWQQMLRGVINVPVVEDLLAVRASGYYENRSGYQKNFSFEGRDQDADDADDFGIRGQVKLTPGDSFETTLRVNYMKRRGVGYGLKRDGPVPLGVVLPPPIGFTPIYFGATPNPENDRHIYYDTRGFIENETISTNADLQWAVPSIPLLGETKLKVLGSYLQHDEHSGSDQDYTDVFIATVDDTEFLNEWVAEVNWASDTGGDFSWLVGLFHMGSTGDRVVDAPSVIPLGAPPNQLPVAVPFFQTFDSSTYSVAGFFNAWYDITDQLQVEGGFRYSHDWKQSHLRADQVDIFIATVFDAIDDSRSGDWGKPSGSIGLNYQITDETLLYTRFSTGYKSGALNNDIAVLGGGIIVPPNADPEDIFALEFAMKNTLLDNRLFANATVFHYWYRDLQVSQLFEATNIIDNAANARVFGIETEFTYRPIDPLTLTAQFAYLDTFYKDYEDCFDAKDLSVQDCTGNQLTRAPRFSGTFIAMYEFDFDRFGTVTPFAQVYASDKVFFRPTNEPADTQDAYFLLNFRLMWQSEGGRLGVDLFVENALDEDVATTKIVGSSLLGAPLLNAYDRPRTTGIRLNLAW